MVLNKKGQVILYGFMLAVTIIVVALAFAYPIWESAHDARNETIGENGATGMNCTNPALSNYDKAACITTDLTPFYFIGILIFVAGAILFAKITFN